jgi:hypothetical protein
MSFRSAPGKTVEWLETGLDRHFSNFLFVERNYGSDPVMRRVLSLARKLQYRSLLIEEISEADCPLLAEENAALRVRHPDYNGSNVHRLSFFKKPADHQPGPDDFCGYAVYKFDNIASPSASRRHVYECVMTPVRGPDWNNFIHCLRTYQVHTNAGNFTVTGVLYAQQNDLTFVCAHVALRTALSAILPEGDITYARLNGLAGVDHAVRKVGDGTGLSPAEFEAVFQSLGLTFHKIVHEPSKGLLLPSEFQRDLYGFVESGSPALMGFELDQQPPAANDGPRHVIPVFGHTFNEDTWLPNAQRNYFGGALSYYPSENWLSTFVVHDDNFGPYYCLPRSFLKQENFRLIYGLVREPTPLNAVEAEAIGFNYISAIVAKFPPRGEEWYDRFIVFRRCGWLVLRTFIVRKADYLSHLDKLRDWNDTGLETECLSIFGNCLPERFWMVEAGAPELFASSRRKFGEVLLVANQAVPRPLDASLLIAARLPGMYVINQGQSLDVRRTGLQGHSALFSMPTRLEIIT